MTCPKCQNANSDNAGFCGKCGTPLQVVQSVQPTISVPPVQPIPPPVTPSPIPVVSTVPVQSTVQPPLEPEKKKPIPLFILLGLVVIGIIIGSSVFVYNKFLKQTKN